MYCFDLQNKNEAILSSICICSDFFLYFGNGAGTRLIGKKMRYFDLNCENFYAFFQPQKRLVIINKDSLQLPQSR
jgi:hypothetical protein